MGRSVIDDSFVQGQPDQEDMEHAHRFPDVGQDVPATADTRLKEGSLQAENNKPDRHRQMMVDVAARASLRVEEVNKRDRITR